MDSQRFARIIGLGTLAVIAVVILARVAVPHAEIWQPAPTATPRPDVGTDRGAWSICQTFVTRQLKAPSTASFAALSESQVLGGSSGTYTVLSYVDAQNGFGAQLRTAYSCKVQYQGGDRWTLLDLKTDQP